MKRLFTLILMLSYATLWAEQDPAPKLDLRMARELQARVYGEPAISERAERPELALALAEMGMAVTQGSSASQGLSGQDYDALYSLLQRYRDDLLKMGLESSDLDAQLKTLKLRADELKERLDKLKPRDGMKIHARMYSFFDDMHLLGNGAIANGPLNSALLSQTNKPTKQSVRYQVGGMHTELHLTGTRGPLSGEAQFDITLPWGLRNFQFNARRVYLELRLPVTMQFGDITANLTPLTLWRNDRYQPFEPELFAVRELRLRDDMLMVPDKWRLRGARLSTDLKLFNAFSLELESTTFIAGDVLSDIYTYSPANPVFAKGVLGERIATYGEAWRVALPLFEMVTLSNNGLLFWDESSTRPSNLIRAMNSLVSSEALDLKLGLFHAGIEYAMSTYSQPYLVSLTAQLPLTGTALTYFVGFEHKDGHVRAFGRSVDNSFHSTGAQGRTVDEGYQYFGYFMSDQSQVNAQGDIGLDPKIQISFASRLNDTLIPPGVFVSVTSPALTTPQSQWLHLLAYNPLENIDPYGQATPNRAGYGVESEWKFLGGFIKPKISYEMFGHATAVADNSGNTLAPFSMNRLRAGLFIDLKPMLGWAIRLNGGYTVDGSSNGQKNAAGKDYALNSTLMEGGAGWDFLENMGINFGYRHIDLAGLNERFTTPTGGTAYDNFGGSLWWSPLKDVRFDMVYTQLFFNAIQFPLLAYEMDQALIRMTVYF